MSNAPVWSYPEVVERIEDAKKRRDEATTEYEWEMATAELEELEVARDYYERDTDDYGEYNDLGMA